MEGFLRVLPVAVIGAAAIAGVLDVAIDGERARAGGKGDQKIREFHYP